MGKVVTREWRKAKSAKLEFPVVSAFRDNSSFGLNILGPLCFWQCLISDGWNIYLPGQDQNIEGARLTLNGKI